MVNKVASKGNLILLKNSMITAKLGFSLLEKKKNILVRELMLLVERAKKIHTTIDISYSDAYLALQQSNASVGLCDEISMAIPEDSSLTVTNRSVMGIEIPIISIKNTKEIPLHFSLYNSNSNIDDTYLKFQEVKRLTVEYAEVEISIYRLTHAITKIKKKSNALKNVVIPNLEIDIKKNSDILEEKEREEFMRLKIIKKQK